ncbi:MAG: serine/threonine-protein kinase, partial [Holophagales bacterium]|nr:serine/threonine-protein kinase [Holophagales bacterium]
IAKVLDGGLAGPSDAAAGRPYFVMELVRGLPITEYCDHEGLGTVERIELFLEVCAAVQHAHQKGVIHRDLKPSNVLVTIQDGRALPKVIDFGVAKAMHGRLTDKTLFTATHRLIGTPAYMSPEQAEMSALDIDTRSDVYSLGALLYELLTGSTPFERATLARAGLGEVQRILREEVPPRPSARVARSPATAASSSGGAGSDGSAVARRLAGDLDWIVMKCLEKERGRRYGTATELAEDLRRHLRDEPVLAGPPSRTYRLRKLLVRHRAAVVSAALVVLALVGGTVGTAIGLFEASRQRDSARREAEHAGAVTDFLVGTLALADPEVALDPTLSVRRLLDRASAQIDGAFDGQPVAESRVRSTLGRAYESLGENVLAERHLRRAVELSDAVLAGIAPSGTMLAGTVLSESVLGAAALSNDGAEASELEPARGAGPDTASIDGGALHGLELYDTLWALTHVLFKLERPDAQAVAHRARKVAHNVIRVEHPELALLLDRFTDAIRSGIHVPDPEPVHRALERLEEAMALADRQVPPGDPLWPVIADSCMDGAYTLWYTIHEQEAEPMLEHVLRIRRRELPPSHADTGEAVSVLAGMLARAGRPAEAETRLREVVRELTMVFPEDGFQVAFARSMLGDNLAAQGKFEEAEPHLRESHDVLLRVSDNVATFFPIDSYGRILRLYDSWDKPAAAEPYRMGLARLIASADWPITWPFSHQVLGPASGELRQDLQRLQSELGGWEYNIDGGGLETPELLPTFERVMAERRRLYADEDPRSQVIARVFMGWANALRAGVLRRRLAEASFELLDPRRDEVPLEVAEARVVLALEGVGDRRRHLDTAFSLLRGRTDSDSWFTANIKARIARAFLELGEVAEGHAILLDVRRTLEVQLGPGNRDFLAVSRLLAPLETPGDGAG